MRRVAIGAVLAAGLAIGAAACGGIDIGPRAISAPFPDTVVHRVIVSPDTAMIKVADHLLLAASVDAGIGATDRSVVWSTSDASIASVSQTGLVTPTGVLGVVIITAASHRDTSVKGNSKVTVS